MFELAWNLLIRFGGGVFQYLIDSAYRNAAMGTRDWVVVIVATWGLAIIAFIFFILSFTALVPTSYLERLRKRARDRKVEHAIRRRILRALLFIIGESAIFIMAVGIFVDLQLNTSFNQRVTVLAAFVSDATVKSLRAEWAQMKSRKDYLTLNSRIEQLAAEHNISLPEAQLR